MIEARKDSESKVYLGCRVPTRSIAQGLLRLPWDGLHRLRRLIRVFHGAERWRHPQERSSAANARAAALNPPWCRVNRETRWRRSSSLPPVPSRRRRCPFRASATNQGTRSRMLPRSGNWKRCIFIRPSGDNSRAAGTCWSYNGSQQRWRRYSLGHCPPRRARFSEENQVDMQA